MRALILTALLTLLPLSAAANPLKLNSGKVVQVEAIGPMQFAKGKPALTLRYRTQQSIDDLNAVRREVDEIWQHFVVDADRGTFENAIITANGLQTGFIVKTGKSYAFGFKKVDESWRALEPGTRLTDTAIRAFYDRWNWLLTNNNGNALSLYLGTSWKVKATGAPEGATEIDRKDFIDAINSPTEEAKLLDHKREFLEIQIDAKASTARVLCRETTERRLLGGTIRLVERTTDNIVLRDQNLTIESTTSVVEQLIESEQALRER